MKRDLNKSIRYVVFFLAVTIIASGMTKLVYRINEQAKVYEIKEVNATFTVSNALGLAVETHYFNFGASTPGGSSTKELIVSNDYSKPLMIKIVPEGEIANIISPIAPFILEPKMERKIAVTAYAISDKPKNYTGKILIYFIKT